MTTPHEPQVISNAETYATDFYAWCRLTAALVQESQWDAIDREALIEELESLGKSQYRELEHRLEVLVMHLLKWQAQPQIRLTSPSWASTIREQRRQITRLLRDSPSLRRHVPPILDDIYPGAREDAVQEMGTLGPFTPSLPSDPEEAGPGEALLEQRLRERPAPAPLVRAEWLRRSTVPTTCPWTVEQILHKDFWPDTP